MSSAKEDQASPFLPPDLRPFEPKLNSSFADYRLLRACDVPEIVPIIVESDEPTGPFGAKGIGEGCMVNVASAISNAIFHATGVRLTDLCMTPDSILQDH